MNNQSKFAFTTQRPVAILMVVLAVTVFGLISYQQLSLNLMPEIAYPSFTIRTEYPGAAPEEVENVVSRPIEEQLGLIKNMVSITSISRPEQSDVILEFTWDVNLDQASQEIRERLDQVFLDREVERPMILRYDPSLDPVLRLGITVAIPLEEARQIVEDEVARELETIPGVAAAKVKGGLEKEILIKLDEKQLLSAGIRYDEITNRLMQENINLAGGNIREGETEYIVRTLNEFESLDEIRQIIIRDLNGVPVRLRDIAAVELSHKERKVITRVNGRESIEIDIYKEADANIVAVCNDVKTRIFGTPQQQQFVKMLENRGSRAAASPREALMEKSMTQFLSYKLKGNLERFQILADQSIFIQNSIDEVKNTAILGGILAIIILYLFLQHIGTTLIVAISIPLSIVATFAPLRMFDVSLNIMSLGGLALGIGMLVDNSIVVMESIFRCREEGDSWVDSAIHGVSEVGGPVVASTLTTVAVFFPIVFVEGIAGQIFGDLALTVVFSLLASLLVALYFIPMLASRQINPLRVAHLVSFTFTFEKQPALRSFLMLIPQMLYYIAMFFLAIISAFVLFFLSLIFVVVYPFISFFAFSSNFIPFLYHLSEKMQKKIPVLWENFLIFFPIFHFITGIDSRKFFITRLLTWPYYLIRFLVESIAYLLSRTGMGIFSMTLVFFKALGLILLSWLSPLIQLLVKGFSKLLERIYQFFGHLLQRSLRHELAVIVGVALFFLFTLFAIVPQIGSELIPELHQGTFYVNIAFPVGTPVEKTDRSLTAISALIDSLPTVTNTSYYAGITKEDLTGGEIGEHIGRITVNVKKQGSLTRIEEKTIEQIRAILSNITDVDPQISRPVLFSFKAPIEVVIKGYNLEKLSEWSQRIATDLSEMPGINDVQSSIKPGYPEVTIIFDRNRLAHYGLNAYDVARLVKNKIEGYVATKFKEEDRRIDMRVYLKDEQRQKASHIPNIIVNPGGAVAISLASVADVRIMTGPNEIRRINQERSGVITANITDIKLNEAVEQIYRVFQNYEEGNSWPADFSYEFLGQNKEMEVSMRSMIMALILAVFLVYIVMASQFESFLHPFLILFTIPLGLIGVFWVLFSLGMPLSVTVYIGMITLAGIVVNNAIVLIDYINLLRSRGKEKIEAIREAAKVRLRPILITTSTTVLGLLPMALGLGEGAEIRTPMAITIMAGLLSATFLTLVFIPLIYNRFSR